MQTQTFDLKGLARYLGRDARDLEKLAAQGRLPGYRVAGDWRFHRAEVHHWLEKEMPTLSDAQLERFEGAISKPAAAADASLVVRSLMAVETTAVPMEGRTRTGVLKSLVDVANGRWMVFDPPRIVEMIREREDISPTSLAGGVAIPHPGRRLNDEIGESIVAYGRTSTPIAFGGDRGQLTDIFFLVLCKEDRRHLQCLARIARMIQKPDFVKRLRTCQTAVETLDLIEDYESSIA